MTGPVAVVTDGADRVVRDGVRLRVRLFAGAAAAAGTEEDVVDVLAGEAGAVPVVDDLRRALARRHPALGPVLEVATVLVDEVAAGPDEPLAPAPQDPSAPLPVVDVLPPFAGG
ncbi:MoaD/ThiS family protein [Pseudokineococcus basanitobsidens]|uniref:MoaD/ThiS family protein n=1 Tax=Pseudokineococcus basanitobsidens TaxID=1926649 RepID=A0ABU8RMR9_9ACTN